MHFDQAELQALQADVVPGLEIETFQHTARQPCLCPGDGEALAAPRDVHFQRRLDLAQILVEGAAQVGQPCVVHRFERYVRCIAHGCVTSSPRKVCMVPDRIRTST